MLNPEFDRHFAMRDSGPFWQGGPESGRVAMAPGFQAFEWAPFGQRLMDDIACNSTILDFAELVMGPFVQLDSCEITGYESAGSGNTHATGWHRDGFDISTTWNNNSRNIDNGLEWRPGTSSQAKQATAKVPATRRPYTPPLACNYLTYLQPTDGTANNPGLRVIPGSHRDYSSEMVGGNGLDRDPRVSLLRERRRQLVAARKQPSRLLFPRSRPQEVVVDAPAGSVVFTHCGVLHAGSINQLLSTRFFISCYINRVGLPVRDVQQGPVRD